MRVDPITLEVLRNKFDSIADEMELTVLKSSYSTIVNEALDATTALFSAYGEMIAQAVGLPLHLGAMIPSVRRILELFPSDTMRSGDAYVLNDPYDGGTHLPDLIVVTPVFSDGAVVALTCSLTHHQELGGVRPGSTPMNAEEIFQEGLRIPPLRFIAQGQPNETFFKFLERNVRIPDSVRGDLMGQVAACNVGARRFSVVIEEYGLDVVLATMQELVDQGEQLMRHAIAQLPDGRYEFHDYLDNDGVELDRRIPIHVAVEIRGSELFVDLSGSGPQARGPINCVADSTLAAIYFAVRAVCDPTLPRNSGCHRPISVKFPEASVVSAQFPAAVNARSLVIRRVADAMLGALGQAVPDRVPAASNGHPLAASIGGIDPLTSRPFVTSEIGTGGMGARLGKDGIDTLSTDTSNAMNIPVEILESLFPLRVHRYRLNRDSGGAGRWRGGLGFEKLFEVIRGTVSVSHRGERYFTAPWGVWGGGPGGKSAAWILYKDGSRVAIPSKLDFKLSVGDRWHIFTSGAGGYGDPLEREPERVLEDVLDGKVSVEQARESYGVVVDLDQGVVDHEQTAAGRERLREARGEVNWTHDFGQPRGREVLRRSP